MSHLYKLAALGTPELALSQDECRRFLNREYQRKGSTIPEFASSLSENFNNPTVEALMTITPDMWIELGLHPEKAETEGRLDRFAVVRLADKLGLERPKAFRGGKEIPTIYSVEGRRESVHDPEIFRELMDAAREDFVQLNEETNTPFHALSGEQKTAMTKLYTANGLDIADQIAAVSLIDDLQEPELSASAKTDALDLDGLADSIAQQL